MPRSYRIPTLVLASLVVALALALAFSLRGGSGDGTAYAAAQAAPADALANAQRTLTFSGSGDVEMQPDTAQINVAVHGAGDSSDAAQAVASNKMKAVIAALTSLDSVKIAQDDLVTQGVNTARDWEHEGRYTSDQSLGVTIHDPARSGTVIAAATAAGADSVDGPSFSLGAEGRLPRRAPERPRRCAFESRCRSRSHGRDDPRHEHDRRERGRRRSDHVRGRCRGQERRVGPAREDRAGHGVGAGHGDLPLPGMR